VDPNTPFGRIVRLLILTAKRRSEIGGAQACEVDGDRLIIPASRMKMRRPHIVPLTPEAKALIPRLNDPQAYLFGESGLAPFQSWSKSKARLEARVTARLIEQGHIKRADVPAQWQLHDIRRTFSSWMNDASAADQETIDACLAHQRRGVGAIYDRAERVEQRRKAFEAWQKLIADKAGIVV
jgi:integrase